MTRVVQTVAVTIPFIITIVVGLGGGEWSKEIWPVWIWAIITAGAIVLALFWGTASRAYTLEKAAEPNLDIILVNNTIHIVSGYMTIINGDGNEQQIEGTLIRVTVLNKSINKSVRDVRCVIPRIEGYDHAFSNQKLQPLAASPSFQLAAGGMQVVGVLFVPNDVGLGEIFILYDNRLAIGRGLPRKDHRLLVQAQGLDIAPASRWLVVKLDGEIDAYLEDKNGARKIIQS